MTLKKKNLLWPVLGILFLSAAIVWQLSVIKSTDKKNLWKAVFLTNGQVYFGKIIDADSRTFELSDVYYLKNQQSLQQSDQAAEQDISLSKLGRFELHCPEDLMIINKEQVLFWENLKPESKVVQAINRYLETDDQSKKCYEPQT